MHRSIACRRITIIAIVISTFAIAARTAEDPANSAATTQPWAIRRSASGTLLIIEGSSIAVPVPKNFVNGTSGDGPVIVTPDMLKVWITLYAQPLDTFGPQTTDEMLKAIKEAMGSSLLPDTLKVEQDPHYPLQIRYAFNDCHRAKVVVLDRFKVFGGQMLRVSVEVQASATDALANQDHLSDNLFASAKMIQRKAVVDHEEVQDTAAANLGATALSNTAAAAQYSATPARTGAANNTKSARVRPPSTPNAGGAVASSINGSTASTEGPTPAEQAAIAKNQRAATALEAAMKLQTDGNDDQAYARFKSILIDYPTTDSAAAAKSAVEKYEADPAFVQRHKRPDPKPADKAAALLSLADNYVSLGKLDAAKAKYQQILDEYANTPSAAKAKKQLADLASR